jgi:phosphopantothenate-cysteine ligase/phosphopantothenoylcysteine decarboxylase/phosphopantothenate--cysteine ligase
MTKKILITAGATAVLIDKVRAITNIFKGRTGTEIAKYFAKRGCEVTLLTSNPDLATGLKIDIAPFKTYDELYDALQSRVESGEYDVIIHSAAVSDYKTDGAYILEKGALKYVDDADKKISSNHKELYLKLIPTEKIIDLVRDTWGFAGTLVKFKLEVGKSDSELLEIARKSRAHSKADFIVANCLEWSGERAFIVDGENMEQTVSRAELPKELYERIMP